MTNVTQYFPKSDETQKGHMKKHRQNVRSTKPQEDSAMHDMVLLVKEGVEAPILLSWGVEHYDVFTQVQEIQENMYTD